MGAFVGVMIGVGNDCVGGRAYVGSVLVVSTGVTVAEMLALLQAWKKGMKIKRTNILNVILHEFN